MDVKTTYTVFWDNSNGTDWDETFTAPLEALRKYERLQVPFKSLVMTDRIHGDRTIINSAGTDNIDALGIRYLFNLAR